MSTLFQQLYNLTGMWCATSCTAYTKWWAPLEYLQYIVWAAFSALRTLALSNMNWTLASSVFVIACIPAAVNFWSVARFGVVGE
ncbi:hypothetical protein GY45DRAFT_679333, partial [Cubamyces sp. BRFM 1775]